MTEGVWLVDNDSLDDIDEVTEIEDVTLAEAPSESVVVGVTDGEDDKLSVVDNVSLLDDV